MEDRRGKMLISSEKETELICDVQVAWKRLHRANGQLTLPVRKAKIIVAAALKTYFRNSSCFQGLWGNTAELE